MASGAVEAYWSWQTSAPAQTRQLNSRVSTPFQTQRPRPGSSVVRPERYVWNPTAVSHPAGHRDRPHAYGNTRRIERLIQGRSGAVLAISVRHCNSSMPLRVLVQRPQQPKVVHPGSRVELSMSGSGAWRRSPP